MSGPRRSRGSAFAATQVAMTQEGQTGNSFEFNVRNLGPASARGVEIWLRDSEGQTVSTHGGGSEWTLAEGEVVTMTVELSGPLELVSGKYELDEGLEGVELYVGWVDGDDERHVRKLDTRVWW
jgi:hypothetical protein